MEGNSNQRRLAAILAADVAGYTQLVEQDTDDTVAAWKAARDDVIKPRVGEKSGHMIKFTGDGFLVEFPSVQDAVDCAIALQEELASSSLDFRMGINVGDITDDGGDVHGEGVNIAARLEALADPGGICISGDVYNQVRNRIDADFKDMGEQEMKHISQPVRVYAIASMSKGMLEPSTSTVLALPEKPSIAVLPFDNMSNDPDQEFFADGISEDVITQLSNFESLFVIARNSSFAFKGQSIDIKDIGEKLGVRYVVEGSVRKAGNRVRITAQLIDATTDQHVWAERYDRDLEDIFVLQDEVTIAIVAAIEPHLASTERQRAKLIPPENLGAWESYQRGLWHLYQYTAEDSSQAKVFFRRAISLDPNFSSAYAGLAFDLYYDNTLGFASDRERILSEAFDAGKQAIQLDQNNPYAYVALGRVLTARQEHETAIANCDLALTLNPSYASAHFGRAHSLWHLGRPEEAIVSHDRAMRYSPRDPLMWAFMASKAIALILLNRYEEALEWARKGQQQPQNAVWTYMPEVSALALLGRIDEAKIALERVYTIKPDAAISFVDQALPFEHAKDREHFISGLIKAGMGD
ncbi:MAG: tetratricopeptide repeat protein [Rhodospirillales bacterium]|nr:tetratricopeptide repeat protein [Rhodospirillales bacterium]